MQLLPKNIIFHLMVIFIVMKC